MSAIGEIAANLKSRMAGEEQPELARDEGLKCCREHALEIFGQDSKSECPKCFSDVQKEEGPRPKGFLEKMADKIGFSGEEQPELARDDGLRCTREHATEIFGMDSAAECREHMKGDESCSTAHAKVYRPSLEDQHAWGH